MVSRGALVRLWIFACLKCRGGAWQGRVFKGLACRVGGREFRVAGVWHTEAQPDSGIRGYQSPF